MAHSEVRGGDAPSAAGMCEGATGETLPAPPPRPPPPTREKLPGSPSPQGGDHPLSGREPGLPLGAARRRHQLHPGSGARPRPPPPAPGWRAPRTQPRSPSAGTARLFPTPPPRGTWRVFLTLRTPVFEPPPAPALRLEVASFESAGSSLRAAETRQAGAASRPPLAPPARTGPGTSWNVLEVKSVESLSQG
ncbi:uncharacterized protein LOC125755032 [Canis lupus dingo]|uniref:uncharacterized protein LOC125755032 n=1 Tax=Canis lupus dingo TaxID=286419 RepID=UPI0020C323EC|nr:uncharacterized protein LOC125755032 [Canis lupus dingo]XP_048965502.1 uncharacterized protein LOC125755032 [Canis lupus dingo]